MRYVKVEFMDATNDWSVLYETDNYTDAVKYVRQEFRHREPKVTNFGGFELKDDGFSKDAVIVITNVDRNDAGVALEGAMWNFCAEEFGDVTDSQLQLIKAMTKCLSPKTMQTVERELLRRNW